MVDLVELGFVYKTPAGVRLHSSKKCKSVNPNTMDQLQVWQWCAHCRGEINRKIEALIS